MRARDLQNLLIDNISTEDLILAVAALRTLDAGYQEASADPPEWVVDQLSAITHEINQRNKLDLQKQLKTAEARRAALATADEKRQRLDEKIAALRQKLA